MQALKKAVKYARDKIYNTSRDIADGAHRQAYAAEYAEIDPIIDNYLAALSFTSLGRKRKNQAYKLLQLKQLLEKHQPRNILEFGSGSSSVVIKNYAKKHGARFTTVDESEDWAKQARQFICEPGDDTITVIAREKVCDVGQDPPSITYSGSFDGAYDFVFIDGPSLTVDGKTLGAAANKDVLGLSPLPKVIAVDGRQSTANLIKKLHQDKYHVALSDLFGKGYIKKDYNYLSVFVRKD